MKRSITHDEAMARAYRKDPAFAQYMLDEALKEEDQAEIRITLRHLADAFGGVGMLSDDSQLSVCKV